jgi:hypothetical protein
MPSTIFAGRRALIQVVSRAIQLGNGHNNRRFFRNRVMFWSDLLGSYTSNMAWASKRRDSAQQSLASLGILTSILSETLWVEF